MNGRRPWAPAAVALMVLAGLSPGFSAGAAAPQVNLLVEMRAVAVVESTSTGGPGGFVVGTRGGSPAAAGDVRLGTRRESVDDTQQVLVVNGGTAALRASRLLPLSTGYWAWAGSGAGGAAGGGVGQTRQWIDIGRGFQVRPGWPGASAPVTLEISAEAAQRTTVQTRLLLPPRTWTEFARNAQTALQVRVSPQP